MNSSRHSTANLPPHFQRTMRVLFNVMDADRSGTIRLADFERKWSENRPQPQSEGIPAGFLDCLKAVCPANGELTYERFCAGLRLALAQVPTRATRMELLAKHQPPSLDDGRRGIEHGRRVNGHHAPLQRVASEGSLTRQKPQPGRNKSGGRNRNENIYANHVEILKQRKMPSKWKPANGIIPSQKARAPPPPYQKEELQTQSSPDSPTKVQLRRYPMPPPPAAGVTNPHLEGRPQPKRVEATNPIPNGRFRPISSISTASSHLSSIQEYAQLLSNGQTNSAVNGNGAGGIRWRDRSKTNGISLNDGRRHTVSEEMDGRAMRNERRLEEERELVHRGLEACTRLTNWYNERVTSLNTQQKFLGKGLVISESAVHEERLNYLRAHISELNRRIGSLMECSDKGFPSRINLETRNGTRTSQNSQPLDEQIQWLQRLNRQLSDEISIKTRQMQDLENENRTLQATSSGVRDPNGNTHYGSPARRQPQQPVAFLQAPTSHSLRQSSSGGTSSSPSPISSGDQASPPPRLQTTNGGGGGKPPPPPVPKKQFHATLM